MVVGGVGTRLLKAEQDQAREGLRHSMEADGKTNAKASKQKKSRYILATGSQSAGFDINNQSGRHSRRDCRRGGKAWMGCTLEPWE